VHTAVLNCGKNTEAIDHMARDPIVETDDKTTQEREDFDRLLLRLDPDPSKAGDKHVEIRRMVARYFEYNCCIDPDERAQEALSVVARKLKTEDIHGIAQYAYGVAKKMLPRCKKKAAKEVSAEVLVHGLDDFASHQQSEKETVDRIDNKAMLACLWSCLAKLNQDDRRLAIAFYSAEDGMQIEVRKGLAEAAGQTRNAFTVRMHRLREKLEECVKKRLNERRKRLRIGLHRQHPSRQ
jgi:DNA-directed RNA polymerase specialized sigma24 family protein